MAYPISDKVVAALQSVLERDAPIDDLDLDKPQKERLRVCVAVWRRMQDDPNVDLNKLLVKVYNRSITQMYKDKEIISFLIGNLNKSDREINRYIVEKNAKTIIGIGESTGDWKAIAEGNKQLKDITHAGEPEADEQDRAPRNLPLVFTQNVQDVSPSKQALTADEYKQLIEKSGAHRDDLMDYVQRDDGMYVTIEEMQRENRRLRARAKYEKRTSSEQEEDDD